MPTDKQVITTNDGCQIELVRSGETVQATIVKGEANISTAFTLDECQQAADSFIGAKS